VINRVQTPIRDTSAMLDGTRGAANTPSKLTGPRS